MVVSVRSVILKLIPILEKVFWSLLAIYAAFEAYQFIVGNISYNTLNDFLAQKVFLSIIAFEVIIIALMRVAEESHMKMLYVIVVVAVLAIAREMFLKHNVGWDVSLSLLLTTITAVILYIITHKDQFSDFVKKFRDGSGIKK